MLDQLTKGSFDPYLNECFRIQVAADRSIEVRLIEAAGSRYSVPEGAKVRRAPFSLVFRGPKNVYLPQRIYTVEHEKLGALEIFLVPIQPDGEGSRFEAVFN
jgi:hypothetical protein